MCKIFSSLEVLGVEEKKIVLHSNNLGNNWISKTANANNKYSNVSLTHSLSPLVSSMQNENSGKSTINDANMYEVQNVDFTFYLKRIGLANSNVIMMSHRVWRRCLRHWHVTGEAEMKWNESERIRIHIPKTSLLARAPD